MIVTKKMLASVLLKYINRGVDLPCLVGRAEGMIKDADLEKEKFELLRDILSRIGLANVREFGLSWDDCHDYLHKLGYNVKVEVSEVT